MEKKFNFSDQPMKTKIIYGAVIAILCFSAVIIGPVAANRKPDKTPDEKPEDTEPPKEALSFAMPTNGEIMTAHSITVPVFSETLGEWRMHTGVDIATEVAAPVYSAERGTVSRIFNDPMLGTTVAITHEGGIVTEYANLNATLAEGICEGAEVAKGAILGVVGDTAISEVGAEAHLHFGMKINGTSVNPMDYIEDQKANTEII